MHPTTGRSFWLLLPAVSIVAFNIALANFANFVAAGTTTEIRLPLDGAGWHKRPNVCWPGSVKPLALPPYSPELQPAELLWHLIDKPVINRHFDSLNELQNVIAERCVWLQDNPDIVKSATNFHWWPQAV